MCKIGDIILVEKYKSGNKENRKAFIYWDLSENFSKLIGFLLVALIVVGLVFNAAGVKDVLLELFNKIVGA